MTLEIPPNPKDDAIVALAEFLTGGQNGYHSICASLGDHHRGPAERFFRIKKMLLGEHVSGVTQAVERLNELLK